MPMNILDAEARITTYCANYMERMESVGYGDFIEDNPKKSVRILCSRLKPEILKKEMRSGIEYDLSLEKSVNSFIKVLIQEAISCQTYSDFKNSEQAANKKAYRKNSRENKLTAPSPTSSTTKLKPI